MEIIKFYILIELVNNGVFNKSFFCEAKKILQSKLGIRPIKGATATQIQRHREQELKGSFPSIRNQILLVLLTNLIRFNENFI